MTVDANVELPAGELDLLQIGRCSASGDWLDVAFIGINSGKLDFGGLTHTILKRRVLREPLNEFH